MKGARPVFKQTQVYTWDLEPADEGPSQFASSTFRSTSARPSEFQDSSFMDPAPKRPGRRGRRRSARVWLLAALCLVAFGIVAGWRALST